MPFVVASLLLVAMPLLHIAKPSLTGCPPIFLPFSLLLSTRSMSFAIFSREGHRITSFVRPAKERRPPRLARWEAGLRPTGSVGRSGLRRFGWVRYGHCLNVSSRKGKRHHSNPATPVASSVSHSSCRTYLVLARTMIYVFHTGHRLQSLGTNCLVRVNGCGQEQLGRSCPKRTRFRLRAQRVHEKI